MKHGIFSKVPIWKTIHFLFLEEVPDSGRFVGYFVQIKTMCIIPYIEVEFIDFKYNN